MATTFLTFDPNRKNARVTLSNGNLTVTGDGTSIFEPAQASSIGAQAKGKWYWEYTCGAQPIETYVGVAPIGGGIGDVNPYNEADNAIYRASDGFKLRANTASSYGATWTAGDVIGVALDLDNGAVYFRKNGTWQNSGDPTSGATKTGAAYTTNFSSYHYVPVVCTYNNGTGTANFGATAFANAAPSGYSGWSYDNSYSRYDPGAKSANITLTGGNTVSRGTASNYLNAVGDIYASTGKLYLEAHLTTLATNTGYHTIGLVSSGVALTDGYVLGNGTESYGYDGYSGSKVTHNTTPAYGASYTQGDVISMLWDADAGTLIFWKNGVSQGTAFTGMTAQAYRWATCTLATGDQWTINTGQTAFKYTPTAGYAGWAVPVFTHTATLNPTGKSANVTLSGGNLVATGTNGVNYTNVGSTASNSAGKWYYEATITTWPGVASEFVGIAPDPAALSVDGNPLGNTSPYYGFTNYESYKYSAAGGVAFGTYGAGVQGDVVGVALDMDNGAIYFRRNGTWLGGGVPTSGASKTGAAYSVTAGSYQPVFSLVGYVGVQVLTVNFGASSFSSAAPYGYTGWVMPTIPTSDGAVTLRQLTATGISIGPNYANASLSLSAMTATGTSGAAGAMSMQPITAFGFAPPKGAVTMQPMTANGGANGGAVTLSQLYAYGCAEGVVAVLQPMTATGTGSFAPFARPVMEPMTATGTAWASSLAAAELQPLTATGAGSFLTSGAAVLEELTVAGVNINSNNPFDATLPVMRGTFDAVLVSSGAFAPNLSRLTAAFEGGQNQVAATLPLPTATFDARVGALAEMPLVGPWISGTFQARSAAVADFAIALPSLDDSLSGYPASIASFALPLPPLSALVGALITVRADFAIALPTVTQALGAAISAPPATFAARLPSIHESLLAKLTLAQVATLVVGMRTSAVTTYEQFPFNSFAQVDGRYFAAGPSGIYEIDVTGLDGTDGIASTITFGQTAFGSEFQKRVSDLYAALRSEGDMTLSVSVDEKAPYEYALKPYGVDTLKQRRAQIGKGLRGKYWQFEIRNNDGADFDFDSLNIAAVPLDRRI